MNRLLLPIAQELKQARTDLKLSIRDVEKATGVSASTISRLERGYDVFHSSWEKLCNYYSGKQRVIHGSPCGMCGKGTLKYLFTLNYFKCTSCNSKFTD